MKLFFLVLLVGSFLTILLTWPFANNLTSHYNDEGDYPLIGWILFYNQNAIKTQEFLNQKEYFTANIFYPYSYTLAFSDHLFIPSVIFSLIYWSTNNLIYSVNYLAMMTFILSFFSSFYCVYFFVRNKWAAVVGATVYTFNPLTFAHFSGHLQLMNRYFLPLLYLFGFKFFKEPNFTNAFFLALFFTLNGLSVIYFEVFTIVTLPLLFLPFLFSNIINKNWLYFSKLFKASFVFLIFLPILIYFNLPYLEFSKFEGVKRTIDENAFYSAKPIDYLLSEPSNFIYGNLAKNFETERVLIDPSREFSYAEHVMFLNITPMILFCLGIWYLLKIQKKSLILNNFLIGFGLVLVSSIILTFGPFYKIDGKEIKLPYFFLSETLPFFQGVRVPARFQFITYIPLMIFVSFGALFLFQKFKAVKSIFLILILLLILENLHIRSYDAKSTLLPKLEKITDVLSFLNNKNTMHLPVYPDSLFKESIYLNWITKTNENTVNGYSGYFPSEWLSLIKQFDKNPNLELLKQLDAMEVDYLIIHKKLLEDDLAIFFKNNLNFFQMGKIFEDSDFLIIDLSKYNFKTSRCTNFNVELIPNQKLTFNPEKAISFYPEFILKNDDCFLLNKYYDRYTKIFINMGESKLEFNTKLPILIKPLEEVKLRKI